MAVPTVLPRSITPTLRSNTAHRLSTAYALITDGSYQSMRADLRSALDLVSSHMGLLQESEEHRAAVRRFLKRDD